MASADLAFALELADLADSLSLPRFRALDLRIETKFWDALTDGGEEGPCGWLKDRYGVSWQIVPKVPYELIGDPDREKSQRDGRNAEDEEDRDRGTRARGCRRLRTSSRGRARPSPAPF